MENISFCAVWYGHLVVKHKLLKSLCNLPEIWKKCNQKQPSISVLTKRYSEIMQQIFRTPCYKNTYGELLLFNALNNALHRFLNFFNKVTWLHVLKSSKGSYMYLHCQLNGNAPNTAWKVTKCGVFSGPYFPVFGMNKGIYGVISVTVRTQENTKQKKLRIWTFFTQWNLNFFC